MTLAIILVSIFVTFGVLYINDANKSKSHRELFASEATKYIEKQTNEQRVKELEAEIFGIGIEIRELPGCFWNVTRGVTYYEGKGREFDPDGLTVLLLDVESNTLQEDYLKSKRYVRPAYNSYTTRGHWVTYSMDDMEKKLQETMKKMATAELDKRKKEARFDEILSKYNGKAVEVE